jgi:hypothetical protein
MLATPVDGKGESPTGAFIRTDLRGSIGAE